MADKKPPVDQDALAAEWGMSLSDDGDGTGAGGKEGDGAGTVAIIRERHAPFGG